MKSLSAVAFALAFAAAVPAWSQRADRNVDLPWCGAYRGLATSVATTSGRPANPEHALI